MRGHGSEEQTPTNVIPPTFIPIKLQSPPHPSNEVFSKTASAKFSSTIDLREAYTQIALIEESQHLTAFTWKGLHYTFTRCIFGI